MLDLRRSPIRARAGRGKWRLRRTPGSRATGSRSRLRWMQYKGDRRPLWDQFQKPRRATGAVSWRNSAFTTASSADSTGARNTGRSKYPLLSSSSADPLSITSWLPASKFQVAVTLYSRQIVVAPGSRAGSSEDGTTGQPALLPKPGTSVPPHGRTSRTLRPRAFNHATFRAPSPIFGRIVIRGERLGIPHGNNDAQSDFAV